jgi:nucleoid DNA-binding protein
MTKRDMVVRISEELGGKKITQQDIHHIMQRTLDLIVESLAEGNSVELRNFGVFYVKERKQRIGRNPNKPDHIVTIPSCKIVKFKPGKIMKEKVSG